MTRRPLVLVSFLVLAAGCVSGSAPTETGAGSPAPAPEFDASTGAIDGFVVDDAFTPILHAQVGVKETGVAVTTDAAGAFTFSNLAPGIYTVLAQAIGYESQGRSVTVEAGAAVEVQFLLVPMPTEIPYQLTLRFDGLIECGWGVSGAGSGNCLPIQFLLQQYNLGNPTNTKIIGLYAFPDPTKVAGGVFEMTWNPSAALTSGQLLLAVELEKTGVINGKVYASRQGTSPIRVATTDEPWKDLKPDQQLDKIQTRTFPAGTNPPTFVVNQRFSVFASACYVEECSDLWTAIKDA